jgi:hypothetical protein
MSRGVGFQERNPFADIVCLPLAVVASRFRFSILNDNPPSMVGDLRSVGVHADWKDAR